MVVLAGMQGVEVGDAVHAEHHSLAIDDELALPDLPGGVDDPGKAPGLVQANTGRQGLFFARGMGRIAPTA